LQVALFEEEETKKMMLEPKLGKLIRALNPYTSGAMRTMLCGTDPTNLAAIGADLITLGQAISTYATDLASSATPAKLAEDLTAVDNAEDTLNTDLSISDIPLRIDNDNKQDYMTWVFRAQPYAVKRALRVTYRYQLPPPVPVPQTPTILPFPPTGIFATEHVLIGYAGGNG
jgi:hypothetical protein